MAEGAAVQTMEAMMKATRAGDGHAIRQPTVNTNFEVKGQIFNMITHQCQFRGTPKEDAFEHLQNFKSICNLFKIAQVEDTVIYLRVFPWSLKDDAKDWLESLPKGDIDSWTTMEDKFLLRFFPAFKAAKLQSELITLFRSHMRHFMMHGHSGSLMKKTPDEAYEVISKTAMHSYDWHQEMDVSRSSHVASTETSDELVSVKAQLATFKRQMESMTTEMHAIKVGCELCQGPHLTKDCDKSSMEEQANYLGYVKKGDFALREFPGRRQFFNQAGNSVEVYPYRPPGFNNKNQQAPPRNFQQLIQPVQQPENKMPPLEELLRGFIMKTDESITALRQDGELTKQQVRSQHASIQNLERDVPNEGELKDESSKDDEPKAQEQKEDDLPEIIPEIITKLPLKVYRAPILYPKVLKKDKLQNQYKNFLDMINQISINMPLAKVIRGMPNYGKFLKDLISLKGKYQDVSATFLNEACSVILQKQKLPPKLGDPGSFIIPCLLDDSVVYDALADLGEVDLENKEGFQLKTIRVDESKCEKKGNDDEWFDGNVEVGNVIDYDTWDYDGRFEDAPDDVDSEVISDEGFGEIHE
ncbi:uncharacterized protein [Rutidosis leptorrhynchoides]|uniref:uncharacterized protein n=1 Tax=Rutidosis leptorrhynchoides TaxID=125765 RepID=UPI003A99F977